MSDEELDQFCHENHYVGWFTTSAKSGLNVKKGMNFIITKVMKNKLKLDETMPPQDPDPNRIDPSKLRGDSNIKSPNESKGCCNLI